MNLLEAEFIGVEKERKRIALDLHDSLAQELSAIKMHINALERMENNTREYPVIIQEIKRMVESSLMSIKEISYNLTPRFIENQCLSESIESLVNRYRVYKSRTIDFFCQNGVCKLDDKQHELHLYRIIQEFINNSIKYGSAEKISIEIFTEKNRVRINLSDDGLGFIPEENGHSLGIASIESRLKLINAVYRYYSIPDYGTKLKIILNEKHN